MTRLVPLLTFLVLAAGAAGSAHGAILPSIYVDYSDDCVFSMHADGGIGLTATTAPGATIPPGSYQVVLRVPQDAPSCPMDFQLQGPGVQLHWDFGGEAIPAQVVELLQPSATYVATDLRNPARFRAVFSTAASGSSSSLVTQPASTAKGGESSHDVVGSARLAYRGVLGLTVRASGTRRAAWSRGRPSRASRPGATTWPSPTRPRAPGCRCASPTAPWSRSRRRASSARRRSASRSSPEPGASRPRAAPRRSWSLSRRRPSRRGSRPAGSRPRRRRSSAARSCR